MSKWRITKITERNIRIANERARKEEERLRKKFAKNILKRRLENEDLPDGQYTLKLEWLVEQFREAWEKEKAARQACPLCAHGGCYEKSK